jgi:hypothetical protein
MPTFDVDREEITAFEFGGRYIFKQYFDNDDLFQELEQYYKSDKYRFEVPEGELSEVRQVLDNYFYELEIADSIEEYCVVQQKEADSSTILRNAVLSQRQGNHDIFLMKDKLSVRQAVEQGASHGKKSDLEIEGI